MGRARRALHEQPGRQPVSQLPVSGAVQVGLIVMKLSLAFVLCGGAFAASLHLQESAFTAGPDGKPAGWTVWSARAETAPRTFVDALHYRSKPGSLAISGN